MDEHDSILEKYTSLFEDLLGTFQGVEAKIYVDAEATPLYHKARPVHYALKKRIEEELERLEREGTIEPVEHSEWAAPIVRIVKSN